MALTGNSMACLALSSVLFALPTQQDQQGQKPTNQQKRVITQQTIVVGAGLTKEEMEEFKAEEPIQTALQDARKAYQQQDYDVALNKYRSIVEMAEPLKSEESRNKYLSIGYGGIGDCYLAFQRFAEAEGIYQKRFDYLKVWPGVMDSDYALNYESIGLVRMSQQEWKKAEEPLQQAISTFDQQIAHFKKSDEYTDQDIIANDDRTSQDMALSLLAVVFYREQRYADALMLLERAYNQAYEFHAPAKYMKQIVDTALGVATAAGDTKARDIWLKRSSTSN
jgi:tetratricopeptide (TPR) repeat protein